MPKAKLYIVTLKFHCNGVCNTDAVVAMRAIIGRDIFDGRVRMNANQLCDLMLAQRGGAPTGIASLGSFGTIHQYEIADVEEDVSGLIDVSGR